MATIGDIINQSREQTIQSQVNKPVELAPSFSVVFMARSGLFIPSWWSPSRDRELRKFWKGGDHISGAIYAMTSKMTSIPTRVVARDPSIQEHVRYAEQLTEVINSGAQFGKGWQIFFSMFVEDLLTQDNGAFAEIIGPGPKDGALTGLPISVAHLDSSRCVRTGNAEFPVVYWDTIQGKTVRYKLHWTRVMEASQMTSPDAEMNGVGFCGLSRAINNAQSLIDILNFKQEKLGSRPHRGILLTQGGLDPIDVKSSFDTIEGAMDTQGLSRYSKIAVVGSAAMPEADMKSIDLASLPDGFNEETSIVLGMAAIALALGVDARELFPAMQSGATRADALLAHLKQRGKGPGQIISTVERLFDTKFLPRQFRFEFDFQDDAQDRQVADIRNVRATRRTQDLNTGALTVSAARRLMVEDGDLSEGQFELMELQEGRLMDGAPLVSLFYSDDTDLKKYLDIGTDDPFDLEQNDAQAILQTVREKMVEASQDIHNQRDPLKRRTALRALILLAKLEQFWLNPEPMSNLILGVEATTGVDGTSPRKPDERTRRMNLAEPNQEEELDTEGRDGLQESSDDNVANAGLPDRGAK